MLRERLHVLSAVVRKDFIRLRRDRAGLAVLFLMPFALVLVISLIQNSVLKGAMDSSLELLLINNDGGVVGQAIENGLRRVDRFHVQTEIAGRKPTPKEAQRAVLRGDFKACIVVPEGTSRATERRIAEMMAGMGGVGVGPMGRMGPMDLMDNRDGMDNTDHAAKVQVFLDPGIPGSFRENTLNALSRFLMLTEFEVLSEHLGKMQPLALHPGTAAVHAPPTAPTPPAGAAPSTTSTLGPAKRSEAASSIQSTLPWNAYGGVFLGLDDVTFTDRAAEVLPTATQQNVPAWTMFAMFFIVVPLSAQIIRERRDGTLRRALVAPVGYGTLLTGKVLVYVCVCLMQFLLMLLVGFVVLPWFGAARLAVGSHPEALAFVALSAALAATGFGVLIGTVARSHDQATMFGSVIIIIFAALGGIMVPVFVMPKYLQDMSALSPLAWGLNAFLDAFLRGGGLAAVLPNALRLLAFFGFTLSAAVVYQWWRRD
jgi:ABC-2 type transport system permease protein